MTREDTFASKGEPMKFMTKARAMVFERVKQRLIETGSDFAFGIDDVTAYWFAKEDHGWTVLLSTTLPDSIYYRVRHDVHAKNTTFEVYHKFDKQTFHDEETY